MGKLIHRYGGYINHNNDFNQKKYVSLYAKHYGINVLKVIGGINYSTKNLTPKMKENDIIPAAKRLNVTILLISGELDCICLVPTTKEWFGKLVAPKKILS